MADNRPNFDALRPLSMAEMDALLPSMPRPDQAPVADAYYRMGGSALSPIARLGYSQNVGLPQPPASAELTAYQPGLLDQARQTDLGRYMLGPTAVEREAMVERPVTVPGLVETGMKFMTLPSPLQEQARKWTDPIFNLLPDELAGMEKGGREFALNMPIGLPAVLPGQGSPKVAIDAARNLGKVVRYYMAGEAAWNAQQRAQQIKALWDSGDHAGAAQMATQELLNAGLLAGWEYAARTRPVPLSQEEIQENVRAAFAKPRGYVQGRTPVREPGPGLEEPPNVPGVPPRPGPKGPITTESGARPVMPRKPEPVAPTPQPGTHRDRADLIQQLQTAGLPTETAEALAAGRISPEAAANIVSRQQGRQETRPGEEIRGADLVGFRHLQDSAYHNLLDKIREALIPEHARQDKIGRGTANARVAGLQAETIAAQREAQGQRSPSGSGGPVSPTGPGAGQEPPNAAQPQQPTPDSGLPPQAPGRPATPEEPHPGSPALPGGSGWNMLGIPGFKESDFLIGLDLARKSQQAGRDLDHAIATAMRHYGAQIPPTERQRVREYLRLQLEPQPTPRKDTPHAVSAGSTLTPIQKGSTFVGNESNVIPPGPPAQPGINREATADNAAAIARRNEEAAHAWLEGIARNDPQASRNAAQELSRAQVEAAPAQRPGLLDDPNTPRQAVRTPPPNVASLEQAPAAVGARPPQERGHIGQPSGELGALQRLQAQLDSLEASARVAQGPAKDAIEAQARTVGEALRLLQDLQDPQKQARSARDLLRLLSEEIPQLPEEINRQIKETLYATSIRLGISAQISLEPTPGSSPGVGGQIRDAQALADAQAKEKEAGKGPPESNVLLGYIGTGQKVNVFDPEKIREQTEGYGVYVAPDLNEPLGRAMLRQGEGGGWLSTVRLNIDPKQMLYWEEPLRNQPKALAIWEKVRQQAEASNVWRQVFEPWFTKETPTGADLYVVMRTMLGSNKNASQTLMEAGFQGNAYPAGVPKPGLKRPNNYVIFDPKRIQKVSDQPMPRTLAEIARLREAEPSGQGDVSAMPSTQLVLEVRQNLMNAGLAPELIEPLMNSEMTVEEVIQHQIGYHPVRYHEPSQGADTLITDHLKVTKMTPYDYNNVYHIENRHPTGNFVPNNLEGQTGYFVAADSLRKAVQEMTKAVRASLLNTLKPLWNATAEDAGLNPSDLMEAQRLMRDTSLRMGGSGSHILIVDGENLAGHSRMGELSINHALVRVNNAIVSIFDRAREILAQRDPIYGRVDYAGINIANRYRGVNIAPRTLFPDNPNNQIFLNLFSILNDLRLRPPTERSPAQNYAHAIIDVITHEMAHQKVRPDNPAHRKELRYITARLEAELREYEAELVRALEEKSYRPGRRIEGEANYRPMLGEPREAPEQIDQTNYEQLNDIALDIERRPRQGDIISKIGSRSGPVRRLLDKILGRGRPGAGAAGQGTLPGGGAQPAGPVGAGAQLRATGAPTPGGGAVPARPAGTSPTAWQRVLNRLWRQRQQPTQVTPPPPAGLHPALPPVPVFGSRPRVGGPPAPVPAGWATTGGGAAPPLPPGAPLPAAPAPPGGVPPVIRPTTMQRLQTHLTRSLHALSNDISRLDDWWEHFRLRRIADPAHTYQDIAQLRDAGTVLAKKLSREVSNHIRKAYPSQTMRESIPFAIESGQNPALLQQFESLINTAPPNYDATMRQTALEAVRYAQAHWYDPDYQAAVRDVGRIYHEQRGRERAAGVDVGYTPNYVGHYWDWQYLFMGPGVPPVLASPSIAGRSFMRGRTLRNLAQGIHFGIPFLDLDVANLVEQRVATGQELVEYRRWWNHWRNVRDPVDGLPIITNPYRVRTQGGKWEQRAPNGYVMFSAHPGRKGNMAVHRGWSELFKDLTDPSWMRASDVRMLALRGAAGVKHKLLFFDTFHLSFLIQSELAAIMDWRHPISSLRNMFTLSGSPIKPAYERGLSLLEYAPAELKGMFQRGEITQEIHDYAIQKRPIAYLGLMNGLNVAKFADDMHEMLKGDLFGTKKFSRYVFDKVSRGAMMQVFIQRMEQWMADHPQVNQMQSEPAREIMTRAARDIARDVNIIFGNIGRQGIFKSQTARDMVSAIILAPSWVQSQVFRDLRGYKQTLGAVGQTLGAPSGYQLRPPQIRRTPTGATLFVPAIQMPNEAKFRMGLVGATLASGMLGYLLMVQIINLVTRGKPTWENPEDDMKWAAWIPDVVGKVTGEPSPGYFLHAMGRFGEITHDLYRYYEDREEPVPAAAQILENKYGPLGRFFYVLMTQSDPFGHKLHGTGEMIKQLTLSVMPWPIMFGGLLSNRPGSIQKQAMSSLGVKTQWAPFPSVLMQQKARKWAKANGKTSQVDIAYQAGAPYLDMRWALRANDRRGFQQAYQKAMAKPYLLTPRQMRDSFFRWSQAPFSGRREDEGKFRATLSPDEIELYQKGVAEKRALYEKFVQYQNEAINEAVPSR